jgi:membrane-bound serine protease (ClpP class)
VILAAFILFAVALAFVAAELFIPSHGILGIFAMLLALAGVGMAWKASPAFGVLSAILVVVIAPVVFYLAIQLYPRSAVGKRVILAVPDTSTGSMAQEAEKLAALLGQRGTALTLLRPSGACEFDNHRIDCTAESEIITAGTPVEVIRVTGTKVIVKAV